LLFRRSSAISLLYSLRFVNEYVTDLTALLPERTGPEIYSIICIGSELHYYCFIVLILKTPA